MRSRITRARTQVELRAEHVIYHSVVGQGATMTRAYGIDRVTVKRYARRAAAASAHLCASWAGAG